MGEQLLFRTVTVFPVGTIQYDALGRRTLKYITNSADWDRNYQYFYDGHRLIEERQLDGVVAKQHVWGTQYVDELVQIATNDDPTDGAEDTCETTYYALQDANYNVLGVVDSSGDLAERYEQTPYGEHSVFMSAGSNDATCKSRVLTSRPVTADGADAAYGICDVGFQGKLFDKEWGLYVTPYRNWSPTLARWMQNDPTGHPDGSNRFEGYRSNPLRFVDIWGLAVNEVVIDKTYSGLAPSDVVLETIKKSALKVAGNVQINTDATRADVLQAVAQSGPKDVLIIHAHGSTALNILVAKVDDEAAHEPPHNYVTSREMASITKANRGSQKGGPGLVILAGCFTGEMAEAMRRAGARVVISTGTYADDPTTAAGAKNPTWGGFVETFSEEWFDKGKTLEGAFYAANTKHAVPRGYNLKVDANNPADLKKKAADW